MQRVTGIGGVFLVATDPEGLQRWYAEHLGVPAPPSTYDEPEWEQQAGPTVFAVLGADQAGGPHVGPRGVGLSLRVLDLDAMVDQLTGAGIAVEVDPERYPNGRFASTRDPEGNPVQLWEPHRA